MSSQSHLSLSDSVSLSHLTPFRGSPLPIGHKLQTPLLTILGYPGSGPYSPANTSVHFLSFPLCSCFSFCLQHLFSLFFPWEILTYALTIQHRHHITSSRKPSVSLMLPLKPVPASFTAVTALKSSSINW